MVLNTRTIVFLRSKNTAYNEPTKKNTMLSYDEIMSLSPEEFSKKWKENKIQDSSLKLLGAREMTTEDKKHLESN